MFKFWSTKYAGKKPYHSDKACFNFKFKIERKLQGYISHMASTENSAPTIAAPSDVNLRLLFTRLRLDTVISSQW